MELAGLIRDVRAAGIAWRGARAGGRGPGGRGQMPRLERGTNPSTVAEALSVFPSGTKADADGLRLKLACWAAGTRAGHGGARPREARDGAPRPGGLGASRGGRARRRPRGRRRARSKRRSRKWSVSRRAGASTRPARRSRRPRARSPTRRRSQDWADALEACAAEREGFRDRSARGARSGRPPQGPASRAPAADPRLAARRVDLAASTRSRAATKKRSAPRSKRSTGS